MLDNPDAPASTMTKREQLTMALALSLWAGGIDSRQAALDAEAIAADMLGPDVEELEAAPAPGAREAEEVVGHAEERVRLDADEDGQRPVAIPVPAFLLDGAGRADELLGLDGRPIAEGGKLA